ncbi:hypothetical protein ACPV4L_01155 [Vibrio rotiferianus]
MDKKIVNKNNFKNLLKEKEIHPFHIELFESIYRELSKDNQTHLYDCFANNFKLSHFYKNDSKKSKKASESLLLFFQTGDSKKSGSSFVKTRQVINRGGVRVLTNQDIPLCEIPENVNQLFNFFNESGDGAVVLCYFSVRSGFKYIQNPRHSIACERGVLSEVEIKQKLDRLSTEKKISAHLYEQLSMCTKYPLLSSHLHFIDTGCCWGTSTDKLQWNSEHFSKFLAGEINASVVKDIGKLSKEQTKKALRFSSVGDAISALSGHQHSFLYLLGFENVDSWSNYKERHDRLKQQKLDDEFWKRLPDSLLSEYPYGCPTNKKGLNDSEHPDVRSFRSYLRDHNRRSKLKSSDEYINFIKQFGLSFDKRKYSVENLTTDINMIEIDDFSPLKLHIQKQYSDLCNAAGYYLPPSYFSDRHAKNFDIPILSLDGKNEYRRNGNGFRDLVNTFFPPENEHDNAFVNLFSLSLQDGLINQRVKKPQDLGVYESYTEVRYAKTLNLLLKRNNLEHIPVCVHQQFESRYHPTGVAKCDFFIGKKIIVEVHSYDQVDENKRANEDRYNNYCQKLNLRLKAYEDIENALVLIVHPDEMAHESFWNQHIQLIKDTLSPGCSRISASVMKGVDLSKPNQFWNKESNIIGEIKKVIAARKKDKGLALKDRIRFPTHSELQEAGIGYVSKMLKPGYANDNKHGYMTGKKAMKEFQENRWDFAFKHWNVLYGGIVGRPLRDCDKVELTLIKFKTLLSDTYTDDVDFSTITRDELRNIVSEKGLRSLYDDLSKQNIQIKGGASISKFREWATENLVTKRPCK